MTQLTCPNCGTSLSAAGPGPNGQTCPDCCATMHSAGSLADVQRTEGGWGRPRVRLVLVADAAAPAAARRSLDLIGDAMGTNALRDAKLLTSEVVTNAVTHGSDLDGRRTAMTVWLSDTQVRIQVEDGGPGLESVAAEHPGDGAEGRFGLFLVEQVADRWGASSQGGARVWFDLPLQSVTD